MFTSKRELRRINKKLTEMEFRINSLTIKLENKTTIRQQGWTPMFDCDLPKGYEGRINNVEITDVVKALAEKMGYVIIENYKPTKIEYLLKKNVNVKKGGK